MFDEIVALDVYDDHSKETVDEVDELELDVFDAQYVLVVQVEIDEHDYIEYEVEVDDGGEKHLELEQIDDEIDDDAHELCDDEEGVCVENEEIDWLIYAINQIEHIE